MNTARDTKYDSASESDEDTGTILEVCGFKPGTTEDMLSMYFESTRRSGGGEVLEVEVDEAKNKATVMLADKSGIVY